MKKLLTILLTLFLFSSAYADVMRIDRSQVNERVDSKYIIIKGPIKTICLDFNNGVKPILNVKNCTYIESARLKSNGSICYKKPNDKRRCYGTRLLDNNMIASGADLRPILIFDSKSKLINAASNLKINTKALSLFNQADILYKNKQHYKAVKLMRKSADLGFSRAQNTYAKALEKGIGIDIDLDQALIWYKKAAEKGLLRAQFNLGKLHQKISKEHLEGSKISKEHLESSIKWLKKAAKLGYAKAKDYLANIKIPETIVVNKLEYKNGIASSLRVVNNIAYIPNDSEPFTGKYIRKYSNGKKEIESTYKIGKQEGKETWYYKTGKKGRESNYKDGQLDGLEIEWDGGSVVSTINWQKGKKDGLETKRFVDSTIEAKINWRDGKKHGLDTWWFNSRAWGEQGKKRSETNWVDDLKNGISITYRKNGTKQSEIKYLNDKEIDKEYFQDKFAVQKQKAREVLRKKRTQERWANKYKINFVDKKVVSIIPKLPKLLQPSKHSSMFVETIQNKESVEEAELFFYIGQLLIGELSNGLKHNKELGYVYLERAAYLGIGEAFYLLIAKEEKLLESNQEYKIASDNMLTDSNKENLAKLVTITKQYSPVLYQLKRRSQILDMTQLLMSIGGTDIKKEEVGWWSDAVIEANVMLKGNPFYTYIPPKDIVIKNLEDEAHKPNSIAIDMLIKMYSRSRVYDGEVLITKDDKKAEYWARFAMSQNIYELRKPALKVLRALDVKDFREIIKYTDAIKGIAKNFVIKELEASSKYCTVAFLKTDSNKKHVYSYGKVQSCFEKVKVELCLEKMDVYRYNKVDLCLEKIKEADEKGNLDKGYFKNGNNSLIFWGPLGGYEGTKRLMKDHKPLNK